MKQKFLELVEKVKETGIVESFYNSSNVEELREIWKEFQYENGKIIIEIKKWADRFRAKEEEIFAKGEKIESPMEIALLIYIIHDVDDVSEVQIFEDWGNLADAIDEINNDFTKAFARLMQDNYISDITPEKIFSILG